VDFLPTGPSYDGASLDVASLGGDPLEAARRWLEEAYVAQVPQPNAMSLATANELGRPSVRTVLLKAIDEGLVFFTNYGSRKGAELADRPDCALLFPWHPLQRQVRIEGRAERVPLAESAAYFATRPRGAQLGAWASPQSRVVTAEELAASYAEAEVRFPDTVPVPASWGGYVVVPDVVEFWQGRPNRMHDRWRYRRHGGGWVAERLAP
jgi:pyridoxamine 5'-phosphate oxidase